MLKTKKVSALIAQYFTAEEIASNKKHERPMCILMHWDLLILSEEFASSITVKYTHNPVGVSNEHRYVIVVFESKLALLHAYNCRYNKQHSDSEIEAILLDCAI